jgi:H/ACA ribonucleoprotein complex subunit 4
MADAQSAFLAQQNAVALQQINGDVQFIKPSSTTPSLDTSTWPLLLKNYEKLLIRSAHYTPVPAGSSPLKRDLASYIKLVLPLGCSARRLTSR